jgi:putative transposase
MEFTKEQLSDVICKHAEKENGFHDLMEMMINGMMVAERREYLRDGTAAGNKGNGFRPGRSYGQGRSLTFRIPRDRYGNFHPRILAILRDQEDECERLAGTLYAKGLTQEQVGDVFNDIYGEQYSKSSVSRMIDYLRADVSEWLDRSLERYYPIVFVDCVYIKVHRKRSVDNEAFYVILAVKEDQTREVIGIYNKPTESATGWGEMLESIRSRGAERIGLICADGLRGLEDVVSAVYPGTPLQRCVTHLKRNLISDVRNGDKGEVAEDLRLVFRTGETGYTADKAWERWLEFCGKWGRYYRGIRKKGGDCSYKAYFTYLNYDRRIQSMIYTTNWIERLQKDFRRVTRMRGAMPNEESVLLLMGKTAMDKKAYLRKVPRIDFDKTLFPDERPSADVVLRPTNLAHGQADVKGETSGEPPLTSAEPLA